LTRINSAGARGLTFLALRGRIQIVSDQNRFIQRGSRALNLESVAAQFWLPDQYDILIRYHMPMSISFSITPP
jgi:hypothetical protein